MELVFLGGAGAIGASCVAVQLGGRWLLVDAGVRVGGGDRLPDLAFLEGKDLAAIFVTHAHADHIGALPLVHQSFPATPIYASRATMLLMEVMLNDALQVMAKRAVSELEVPLYDETLVAKTIHHLRPLPIASRKDALTGACAVPELPGVTIHAARAGHVAGALSLGFESRNGALLISGDVSLTPQRTILGAALPGLRRPDLLVLESTYGARLHPNRQAEEERLAQAVAAGVARGGHVLIPAFALGRAQEVLRILQQAQHKGEIPEFPVWVDGLVRSVCASYVAMPEALSPPMQRQIEAGRNPFTSRTVRFVDTPRQREQILQGAPACIVASSGMLTGGPSALYAAALAENPQASILITGYQDEESPGRRLLDLAEGKSAVIEIGGTRVQVQCQIAKYALSAHADGTELAAYVKALDPAAVALVHGDSEARAALAAKLGGRQVLLPSDGQAVPVRAQRRTMQHAPQRAPQAGGIGGGAALGTTDLPRLWTAVADPAPGTLWAGAGQDVVSVRELALAWYGIAAGEDEERAVQQVLGVAEAALPYFVPLPELPGTWRVRRSDETAQEDAPEAGPGLQPGALLLLQAYPEKAVPALCYDLRPGAVFVHLPEGDIARNRFPRQNVLELLGHWPTQAAAATPADLAATRTALDALEKEARRRRRQRPPRDLAALMQAGRTYRFADLATALELAADDLAGRLTLALALHDLPRLFARSEGGLYALAATLQEALAAGEGDERPDQMWILAVLERHLGNPPDLYKRSVNPESGEVTLLFHFPAVARARYADALAAAAAEAGVAITVSPQPHQGALVEAARAALPPGLSPTRQPSLLFDWQTVRVKCSGTASDAAVQEAAERFQAQTGWRLEIEQGERVAPVPALSFGQPSTRLDEQTAAALARATLGLESGCYKIGVNSAAGVLTLRFYFPDSARVRYATTIDELAQRSGWRIEIHPAAHQGALEEQLRRVLPAGLTLAGAASLYQHQRTLVASYRGDATEEAFSAATAAFAATTGWTLVLRREGG